MLESGSAAIMLICLHTSSIDFAEGREPQFWGEEENPHFWPYN